MTITSADGTKLAARCSGHGSPLVLVHGANGDLDTFALIEDTLARHHAVWVYSRRGRGGSGDGPGYALEREVEDVRAVLAVAGDGAHLVGHSGGAIYSINAMRTFCTPPLSSAAHSGRSASVPTTTAEHVHAVADTCGPGAASQLGDIAPDHPFGA